MTDIYTRHQKTFESIAAFVLLRNGAKVGTVAFKYARSGLRTTCFFHVHSTPMVSAFASGGGYDKATAAAYAAVRRIGEPPYHDDSAKALVDAVKAALASDGGHGWDRQLEAAGFTVLQAV